jgi:2-amino-4-hydroxy-6-hydroxymethyldihydropteridine diphosphokinase
VTRRVRAYIGLGSNVGSSSATLARAVAALRDLPGARLRRVSRLYATTPVGVTDQPDFLNAVVALDVPAGPDAERGALGLLADLKRLERDFGRQARARWGPRELDLDLLLFGRARIDVARPAGPHAQRRLAPGRNGTGPSPEPPMLQVPHRDVAERLFVLAPLADLAPRLVPPGWRETVLTAEARRQAAEGPAAARPVGTWDGQLARWVPLG